MNLLELKNKARSDFKNWLRNEFEPDSIIGTEPDDWDEAVSDFASKTAGLADPNVILESREINKIDLGDGYPESTLLTGLIFDRVYQYLDCYLYNEFDDIVDELKEGA